MWPFSRKPQLHTVSRKVHVCCWFCNRIHPLTVEGPVTKEADQITRCPWCEKLMVARITPEPIWA